MQQAHRVNAALCIKHHPPLSTRIRLGVGYFCRHFAWHLVHPQNGEQNHVVQKKKIGFYFILWICGVKLWWNSVSILHLEQVLRVQVVPKKSLKHKTVSKPDTWGSEHGLWWLWYLFNSSGCYCTSTAIISAQRLELQIPGCPRENKAVIHPSLNADSLEITKLTHCWIADSSVAAQHQKSMHLLLVLPGRESTKRKCLRCLQSSPFQDKAPAQNGWRPTGKFKSAKERVMPNQSCTITLPSWKVPLFSLSLSFTLVLHLLPNSSRAPSVATGSNMVSTYRVIVWGMQVICSRGQRLTRWLTNS